MTATTIFLFLLDNPWALTIAVGAASILTAGR